VIYREYAVVVILLKHKLINPYILEALGQHMPHLLNTVMVD
jgi:hypothetical protein